MNADDNLPLAVRRQRRSSSGVIVKSEADTLPEIRTPRKRKVRFSDPGLSTSSGLTPMIRRTALLTPTTHRRRASTPSTLSSRPVSQSNPPQIKQSVLGGRVERRLRRSAFKSHLQKLNSAHQRTSQQSKSHISRLQNELSERDREIYELQNATVVIDTDRIYSLEQQIERLQSELKRQQEKSICVDWTMAARDPFEERSEMDFDAHNVEDDDVFGDMTVAQLQCSTPSRARSSFPTPPATSPSGPVPETPSVFRSRLQFETPATPVSAHAAIQATLPDLEKEAEIESLQLETRKLTTTLDSYKSIMERLSKRLPQVSSVENGKTSSTASGGEMVERQVDNVLQTLTERTAALVTLTSTISSLGFAGIDASEMLNSITKSFRAARLELEYLTPGEITLPLISHGAEVLDLLLVRLRDLAHKVKESDDAVDEYHSIELNLRKQLEARVAVLDGLREDFSNTHRLLGEKDAKIGELEIGNNRLKGAVEGYIRDISELEILVERIESEAADKDDTITKRDASIVDLEVRLSTATQRAIDLLDELEVAQASRKNHVASVNRRSGEALAHRDARVAELRSEIDRITISLQEAHGTIRKLRVSCGSVEEENRGLRDVVEGMKGELQRVMKMSEDLLAGNRNAFRESSAHNEECLAGKHARRSSGRKRRRYDSGLGFLEEDEVEV